MGRPWKRQNDKRAPLPHRRAQTEPLMFPNRWAILGIALVLTVLAACALVLARPTMTAESGIEHVGGATVVHGRGSGAAVGYLPSGRYRVTLLESANNCAIGLHLEGEDHHEWFRLVFLSTGAPTTGVTGELPAQQYTVSTDVYFGDGLGGTPIPATQCTWTYVFTPVG